MTTHLVATLRRLDGRFLLQPLAVSEPLHIVSGFNPGPGMLAVLTALMGLVGGAATTVVTKRIESRGDDKKRLREIQSAIATQLVAEMTTCRDLLRSFLADPRAYAPNLPARDYNAILSDHGIMSYLDDGERKKYTDSVRDVYQEMNTYNDAVNSNNTNLARTLAGRIVERLSAQLRK